MDRDKETGSRARVMGNGGSFCMLDLWNLYGLKLVLFLMALLLFALTYELFVIDKTITMNSEQNFSGISEEGLSFQRSQEKLLGRGMIEQQTKL